ncbi:MAG: transcriptional regulator NrdR [Nanoarchaeota archaeon]
MKCPSCSHSETHVVDSRETDDLSATRRRRECDRCAKRFTTYERIDMGQLMVIKKDGRRELFDRHKLKTGMQKACEKCKISDDTIERSIVEIEAELRSQNANEISSDLIGKKVMAKLKRIDTVAYIRFASVYREFQDLNSFEKELQMLRKAKR